MQVIYQNIFIHLESISYPFLFFAELGFDQSCSLGTECSASLLCYSSTRTYMPTQYRIDNTDIYEQSKFITESCPIDIDVFDNCYSLYGF